MNTNGNYFNKDSYLRKLLTALGAVQAIYPRRLLVTRRALFLAQVKAACQRGK